jgi:hypothetical protein
MVSVKGMRGALALAMVLAGGPGALAADDGAWSVSKSSGDVWITTTGAAPASLTQDDTLRPGDTIRTGRTGRVLLVRGEETILIAPNSVIGMPTEKKDGLSTTILQQAGSILLEVEKRNVKHFEVETPYLAAVVKGTQFSVTVTASNTRVDVARGQVEVADFKSGQIAQVMPGQAATSFANGKSGLSLSGSATFNPIEQGKPRASTIDRIPVPRGGLHAPNNAGEGKSTHALGPVGSGKLATNAGPQSPKTGAPVRSNVIRLTNALGEVRLNVQKATHGLAHGGAAQGIIRNARDSAKDTIWSDSKSTTSVTASNSGNGNSSTSGTTSAPGSSSPAASAVVAATSAAAGDSANAANNGNGNGNANGHGNGNANGHGNGNGNGNGATGNGNGNGNGHGNGNSNGNGHH